MCEGLDARREGARIDGDAHSHGSQDCLSLRSSEIGRASDPHANQNAPDKLVDEKILYSVQ